MGKYGDVNAMSPFRGGLAYTSPVHRSLLIFDEVAVTSGGIGRTADAALEVGGQTISPPDLHPAKWRIPERICVGPTHVFADGSLAVLGTCAHAENATLLVLENIDFEAQTIRNRSFVMARGAAQMAALNAGTMSLVAVGVTDAACFSKISNQGHVEIYEESALRSGGEPILVVKTSGAVTSMAPFRDGRLAVATLTGGYNSKLGNCGTTGTVDIIDVAAELRRRSSIAV